jgi:hypothetical protein
VRQVHAILRRALSQAAAGVDPRKSRSACQPTAARPD